MRFFEFASLGRRKFPKRPNLITLRQLNKQKQSQSARIAAEEVRKPLLAAMYGHTVDDSASHEAKLRAVELEQKKIELAKKKAELINLKAEQEKDAYKQIQKLSRSAMRQRKKKS